MEALSRFTAAVLLAAKTPPKKAPKTRGKWPAGAIRTRGKVGAPVGAPVPEGKASQAKATEKKRPIGARTQSTPIGARTQSQAIYLSKSLICLGFKS